MTSESRRAPTTADIKRLFALSANQCAFPNCTISIVENGYMVGEICHIKAANPRGRRYDPSQTAAGRHGFANLILLCANHHKVIDDDSEAYTVARLQKMKAEHESGPSRFTEAEIDEAARLLVNQFVRTESQSGGIAAHTVNAKTINVSSAQRSQVADARIIRAIEALWSTVIRLRDEFGDIAFADAVLTRNEMKCCFEGTDSNAFFDMLRPFSLETAIDQKLKSAGAQEADRERPFVSARLFCLFFAIRAILARAAFLIHLSFRKRSYHDWREDSGIGRHLRAVLPAAEIEALRAKSPQRLDFVIGSLEASFLTEAENFSSRPLTV